MQTAGKFSGCFFVQQGVCHEEIEVEEIRKLYKLNCKIGKSK